MLVLLLFLLRHGLVFVSGDAGLHEGRYVPPAAVTHAGHGGEAGGVDADPICETWHDMTLHDTTDDVI